jgi:hypothetical protein
MTTVETLESHFSSYPSLPKEAILKQDILREGLAFSLDSLKIADGYKPKDYFIFSFDLIEIKDMAQQENLRAPEEIRLKGGLWNLRPTVVSVRLNPKSPYTVEIRDGNLCLNTGGFELSDVEYHPKPSYYQQEMKSGKPIGEIAPVIEWGYLIYLTVFRLCQYFTAHEQCGFCDLNANYKQQRASGRTYTGIKDISEVQEALNHIAKYDSVSQAITVTGGAILKDLQGESEIEFYARYARILREAFGDRWIIKAVVQAFDREGCRQLKNAGYEIYHPNFEIWDPTLFARICPGKERFIGRSSWIEKILEAGEIFGRENVIPNFVGGVEMNQNFGFNSVDEAIESTSEGLDFFMSQGILPRFTTWCPEPMASLGPQPAPPLEYYCKLLEVYRDLYWGHKLKKPRGYGPVGPGKAVFSVSAFMDVIS